MFFSIAKKHLLFCSFSMQLTVKNAMKTTIPAANYFLFLLKFGWVVRVGYFIYF